MVGDELPTQSTFSIISFLLFGFKEQHAPQVTYSEPPTENSS